MRGVSDRPLGPGDLDFLELAAVLGRQIWDHRVHARDGSVTWFRPGSAATGEPDDLRVRVDPFLFDGAAGIALFLAALARTTRSENYRAWSLEAIAPVRGKLAQLVADPQRAAGLKRIPIGGMIGIGSLIYSFLRIGTLLGEPGLISEARDLLTLTTCERIARDEAGDVLYGSAGAILALLALHRETLEPDGRPSRPLEVALTCACRLLSRQVPVDGCAARAWRTVPGFPALGGFSHGAAGICYALLRLHEATGEPRLLRAAEEGFAFERVLYSPAHGNWRDMRFPDRVRFETGWCVGCAGMVLARLATLGILDTAEIREEVEHGLEVTRSACLDRSDHLCCGTMGRVETLLRAYQFSGEQPLRSAADDLARQIFRRASAGALLRWRFATNSDLFDPTLFTGAAGIGYTLLRLAAPEQLPSLFLLE